MQITIAQQQRMLEEKDQQVIVLQQKLVTCHQTFQSDQLDVKNAQIQALKD